jgi:hypothetical protein
MWVTERVSDNVYVPTEQAKEAAKYLFAQGMKRYPGAKAEFISLDNLVVQWGEASIVDDSIEVLPEKVEQHDLHFTNCLDTTDSFKRTIKTSTKRAVLYEVDQSINSSNEFNVGVQVSLGSYLKFNSDIITKNGITTSRKETQSFSEDVDITYEEDFTIPAKSVYKYTYNATKGLIKALIRGRVVVDALITYDSIGGDGSRNRQALWVSHPKFLPRSEDRLVDYEGYIVNEGYDSLDIKKAAKPIDDLSICDFFHVEG